MDTDQLAWIRDGLKQPGKTQSGLAEALGRAPSSVTALLKGERELKAREIKVIADYLGVPAPSQAPPPEPVVTSVPVMGLIGGGAVIEPDFEQVPPEGLYTVEVPFHIPEGIIALEVNGISMMPKYDDKDVVLVWADQRFATESYLGEEVAVRTHDGRRYLKRLLRGPRRHRFTLESGPGFPTIENVGVEWIGEIYLTIKLGQLQRIRSRERAISRRRELARQRETAGMAELPLDKAAEA